MPITEKYDYLRSGFNRGKERLDQEKLGDALPISMFNHPNIPEYIMDVEEANYIAASKYRFSRYPGKITLFRANEEIMVAHPDKKFRGWGHFAEEVEVCDVPGNHLSLMEEPNIRMLASKLQDCINQSISYPE